MSSVWDSFVSQSVDLAADVGKSYVDKALGNQPVAPTPAPAPTTANVASGIPKYLLIGGAILLVVAGYFFLRRK